MTPKDVSSHRIVLFSHPRTRSHLIERMLSAQPNTAYFQHPFISGRPMQMSMLDGGRYDFTTESSREALKKSWQEGYDSWVEFCNNAEREGKVTFTHTHPHFCASPTITSRFYYDGQRTDLVDSDPFWTLQASNGSDSHLRTSCLVIPDSFLSTLTPIFTIRNPLHMIPSVMRISLEVKEALPVNDPTTAVNNSLIWTRELFDWYEREHHAGKAPEPFVIDSDDVVTNPAILESLCKAIGYKKGNVLKRWEAASDEEYGKMPDFVNKIKRTILGSTGVEKIETAKGATLEKELPKWEEEFGDDMAEKIRKLVEAAMDDYNYLFERRLTM